MLGGARDGVILWGRLLRDAAHGSQREGNRKCRVPTRRVGETQIPWGTVGPENKARKNRKGLTLQMDLAFEKFPTQSISSWTPYLFESILCPYKKLQNVFSMMPTSLSWRLNGGERCTAKTKQMGGKGSGMHVDFTNASSLNLRYTEAPLCSPQGFPHDIWAWTLPQYPAHPWNASPSSQTSPIYPVPFTSLNNRACLFCYSGKSHQNMTHSKGVSNHSVTHLPFHEPSSSVSIH